eukprot:TRINITY_DN1506_c0_g1_i1.p2 TRINITY_DN1506_c0_g1~~TRINITY_DN1506_c0_g1_i1.p2  ORF type:complete len:128 (-),score=27.79 TRINITY_DN1506_c0_g1_i1:280-663(-)
MENTSNANSIQRNVSVDSTSQAEETRASNVNESNNIFVNHALILWNERRREWVGNRSQVQTQLSQDPVIGNSNLTTLSDGERQDIENGWNATYDDLLTTDEPFPQPVPLPEMIDFLVDVWHEEGLYD